MAMKEVEVLAVGGNGGSVTDVGMSVPLSCHTETYPWGAVSLSVAFYRCDIRRRAWGRSGKNASEETVVGEVSATNLLEEAGSGGAGLPR